MTSTRQPHKVSYFVALLILFNVSVILASCKSPPPQTSRLPITNSGTDSVKNLTVQFPHDQIPFGDIPAGTTTEYKEVPSGVFPYAAYRFEMDGQPITQPVIDWVGEEPIER
jgi:hypothetical protein